MATMTNLIIEFIRNLANNNNLILVIFVASSVIVLESVVPILPLAVFIALNMLIFGNLMGFLISWIATIVGCTLSFYIFRLGLNKYLYKYIGKSPVLTKLIGKVEKIKFNNLVLITALPFMPAFSINVACGLSKMSYKKFLANIIIAKISIVYFWGFIGKSLIESMGSISTLMILSVILIIMYVISSYVKKIIGIE